jgi:SAM-dependent methyltransferase
VPDRLPGRDADEQARRLAAARRADGDPVGWFEPLYAAAARGQAEVPWDRAAPHPLLVEWAALRAAAGQAGGSGRSALVVGSGLGDDAEFISGLGYRTTGFDVSDSAVAAARARFPGSAVSYQAANLLDLPAALRAGFDLVVEIITVQALPASVRREATAAVAGLPGAGGTLLVICATVDEPTPLDEGPPWPLTLADVEAFGSSGLAPARIDDIREPESRRRWRAEFRRPGG